MGWMEEKQDGGTLISEEHDKFLVANNEQWLSVNILSPN